MLQFVLSNFALNALFLEPQCHLATISCFVFEDVPIIVLIFALFCPFISAFGFVHCHCSSSPPMHPRFGVQIKPCLSALCALLSFPENAGRCLPGRFLLFDSICFFLVARARKHGGNIYVAIQRLIIAKRVIHNYQALAMFLQRRASIVFIVPLLQQCLLAATATAGICTWSTRTLTRTQVSRALWPRAQTRARRGRRDRCGAPWRGGIGSRSCGRSRLGVDE